MSECKTVFVGAAEGMAKFSEALEVGHDRLRKEFGELFAQEFKRRIAGLEAGEATTPTRITVEVPSAAMARVGARALEAAGWRCHVSQQRGKPDHDVEVYVNETLEQYNERLRVSEIADPKPGALAFGTMVRLKHDLTHRNPEKVDVGEIGVVTGSEAWECGTGSSNYVSFPSKSKYSVSPRDEILLSYPAQLEVVEVVRPEVVQPDPAAHRTVAEAVKDEISLSDGREPWRTSR